MGWRALLTHNNGDCSLDVLETIYAPGPLSHQLNHIQSELRDTVGPQLIQGWANLEKIKWIILLDEDDNTFSDCLEATYVSPSDAEAGFFG